MLSADGLDLTTPIISLTGVSLQFSDRPVLVAYANEGGFISIITSDGSVASGLQTSGGPLTYSGIQDFLVGRTFNGNGGLGTWQLFDDGLRPIDFGPGTDASLNPVVTPPIAANPGSETGDGGSIPIGSILAQAGSLENIQRSPRSVSAAQAALWASDEARNLAAASAERSGLTSEWARAVVFEFAGGEPTHSDRESEQATAGSVMTPPGEGAVGAASAQWKVSPVPRNSGAEPPRLPAGAEQPSEPQREVALPLANVEAEPSTDAVAKGLATAGFTQAGSSSGVSGEMLETASAAQDQAFEELGGIATREPYWLATSTKAAANASPLLLMLALERIANRNTRRARRDAAPGA